MDVEGDLAPSYGDLERYLLTPITKNQHPLSLNAPQSRCGAPVAGVGQ